MEYIAVLFANILALVTATSVNYCGSRMCANTNAHTFCQFPEGPSPDCVGYIDVRLTIEEKSRIIARLNRRRNDAASGHMRGLPTAGNMLKLRWVEELAREAQRWADQCRPPRQPIEEHDACRNLYSVTVGQCVASVVGEAPGLRVESMVDIWYMQSILYKGNVTFYMPSDNGSYYGDFAQIIWARSYMVGCGRSRFMIPWQGRLRSVERLVCNIAPNGPPPTYPLWTPAAPAATCPSRAIQDDVLTSLCDYQWELSQLPKVDSSMTIEDHLLLNTVLEIENNETLNYQGSLDQIYLTKLAIATIVEHSITTQKYYNSMQRRDIVEVIVMNDMLYNNSTPEINVYETEVIPELNTTISSLSSVETRTTIKAIKSTKKKLSLVGRPKTYNMEDLTDSDDSTENNTPIERVPKTEKDFYAEYEFIETIDENSTAIIDMNITEASSIENVANQDIAGDVTRLFENSSTVYGVPVNTDNSCTTSTTSVSALLDQNSTLDTGNVSSTVKDTIDDYLSDPETVRELQEALERVEREMAPKPSTERQGKVRRELRDLSEVQTTPNVQKLYSEPYSGEPDNNKTLDRGPMLNMVMKYMPYLKQYDNGLLSPGDGSTGSIANCVSPSIVLVLTFVCNCLGVF